MQITLAPTVDKRLVVSMLLLGLVAVLFWTGSRYPALGDKAAMGGDADISGLAFDQVVEVSEHDPALLRVGGHALNWAYTNKQGMTFGVLFAALILTVLPLFAKRSYEGRIANTLLGVVMGSPGGRRCRAPGARGAG